MLVSRWGDNLVAIAQLAESLDRSSFQLAMQIVPIDWWTTQLPDRRSTAEKERFYRRSLG
jgi:hypothetical protein